MYAIFHFMAVNPEPQNLFVASTALQERVCGSQSRRPICQPEPFPLSARCSDMLGRVQGLEFLP